MLKFFVKVWRNKPYRYRTLTVIWIILTPPTVTIWGESIRWLNFMSITALTLASIAALEGATPTEGE
jgi:hypothetical protein